MVQFTPATRIGDGRTLRGGPLRLVAALSLLVLVVACGAASPVAPDDVPAWVRSVIRALASRPVANPPAFIARYDYKGEVVYYLPPRCCDAWGTVYRADGSILCHPDGGIDGAGDGACTDFLTERRNERIIWHDPRR